MEMFSETEQGEIMNDYVLKRDYTQAKIDTISTDKTKLAKHA